jgi:hypothetical protein
MICPLMSYAANLVECQREKCAVWDKREEACGLVSVGARVQDGLSDLVMTLNEIKVKF